MIRPFIAVAVLALLASCDNEPASDTAQPRDPQVAQALDDPLMTDPDLAQRNEGAAALRVESDGSLPVLPPSPEAISVARAEAAQLVGGSEKLRPPPESSGPADALPEGGLAGQLAALRGANDCKVALRSTAIWAARLPKALPVYPRGATLEATGGDASRCRLRAVAFATPVQPGDVLAFYWTLASAAGLRPVYRGDDSGHQISGAGSGLAFDVRIDAADGGSFVRLASIAR